MTRPNFTTIFMELAWSISRRSTCARLQVGTVITSIDFRKVLSFGYNGSASGLNNCCDSKEVGACGCIHSETNAIINCDSPRSTAKYIFISHSPCKMCAKCLINLGGVQRVYYGQEYRDGSGIELLEHVGIGTIRI